jgi:arylsulfatase A-like enzyme
VRSIDKRAAGSPLVRLVAGLLLGVGGACSGEAAARQDEAARPRERVAPRNLVIVLIDTLRRDHLGAYGYAKPTSPHLDALARESVLFERCLAPSSWTEPSTASLLSGLFPARHGAHEYARLPDDVTMLAETLRDAGFRTGAVSGNPNASPLFGFDQGFETFSAPTGDVAREYPDVSALVAEAEQFLARDDGRRFFLYLHVMNVHGPYRAPPEYRERFLSRPFRDFPFQNDAWRAILRKGEVERRADVTPEHLNDLVARYDGAIAYTDEVLGAFLRRRLATGGDADDLLLVTSDHGEELFEHGGFGHGFTLHREVVDVPLLLRLPRGTGGGRRVDDPVSLVDVPATVLDLLAVGEAGAATARGDGLSLAPTLRGEPLEREAPLVAQLERAKQGQAFLLQQWPLRLIATGHDYAGRRDVVELFDHGADPAERFDLAGRDPARTQKLREALARRREALEAQAFRAESSELSDEQRLRMEALGYGQDR